MKRIASFLFLLCVVGAALAIQDCKLHSSIIPLNKITFTDHVQGVRYFTFSVPSTLIAPENDVTIKLVSKEKLMINRFGIEKSTSCNPKSGDVVPTGATSISKTFSALSGGVWHLWVEGSEDATLGFEILIQSTPVTKIGVSADLDSDLSSSSSDSDSDSSSSDSDSDSSSSDSDSDSSSSDSDSDSSSSDSDSDGNSGSSSSDSDSDSSSSDSDSDSNSSSSDSDSDSSSSDSDSDSDSSSSSSDSDSDSSSSSSDSDSDSDSSSDSSSSRIKVKPGTSRTIGDSRVAMTPVVLPFVCVVVIAASAWVFFGKFRTPQVVTEERQPFLSVNV